MRLFFFILLIIISTSLFAQETGEIECNDCKSIKDTSINNTLILKSAENTVSVVRLVHVGKNECIRKIFIKPGESYTVENIPIGNYVVKFVIGDNWDYSKKNNCKLHFKGDKVFYMKVDKPLSYKKIRKGDTYELSEYTVNLGLGFSPSNAANKKISERDFKD